MAEYRVTYWTKGFRREGFVHADSPREARILAKRKYGVEVTDVYEWLPDFLR